MDKLTKIHWGRTTVTVAACSLLVLGILIGVQGMFMYDKSEIEMERAIESRLRAQLNAELAKEAAEHEKIVEISAIVADLYNEKADRTVLISERAVVTLEATHPPKTSVDLQSLVMSENDDSHAWGADGPLTLNFTLSRTCNVQQLIIDWNVAGLPEVFKVDVLTEEGFYTVAEVESGEAEVDLSMHGHAGRQLPAFPLTSPC
jgi:hypothetical protein